MQTVDVDELQARIADQLPQLVAPLQRIIGTGVAKKGFHPVAISHAMMIAGMVELFDAAGKEFTIEMVSDMLDALQGAESGKDLLQ